MNRTSGKPSGRDQRGFSMVEMLVAVAILVIAGLVALMLYDTSRKSFKTGENATEAQQAVRIAFDRLNADLRMAGFNVHPDGDGARPDEQIEAAYDTAVVLRADLDAEDPAESLVPEQDLDGGAFSIVSTGNDEVVAYVLAKPDGSSTGSLTFQADVGESPRDGDVELVTINNVALVQDPADAPFTLYRVTLGDAGTWGGPDFIVKTPLVENVRSMTFRYFDLAGAQANDTFDLNQVADDIGGTDVAAAKATRGSIRRVYIELEGMTRDPDLKWVDPDDPEPNTQHFRKYSLAADVTPRNIGLKGIRDLNSDLVPPSKPGAPSLVDGHCKGLLAGWTANPADEDVVAYVVSYGTAAGAYTSQITTGTNFVYMGGLVDGQTYYVAVQARDAAGNISVRSNEDSQVTNNQNTPETPAGLTATDDQQNEVDLVWGAVTENVEATAGDPVSPLIRDLAGYRLYRGTDADFTADAGSLVADESVLFAAAGGSYSDQRVVNCRDYWYRVAAVDQCGVAGDVSDAAQGRATTAIAPKAPTDVQAFVAGLFRNRVTWKKVTQDVQDSAVVVDTYHVYRSDMVPDDSDPDSLTYSLLATVTSSADFPQYLDNAVPPVPAAVTVFYKVSALDACPNESALSEGVSAACAFAGTVQFDTPADGQVVAGVTPIQVSVVGGGLETYRHLLLEAHNNETGETSTLRDEDVVGSTWTYNWLADPPGPYTLTALVTNSGDCVRAASIDVTASAVVGCCLAPNPNAAPIVLTCAGGAAKCKEVSYNAINNNCQTSVAIDQITITWNNFIPPVDIPPKLKEVWFDKGQGDQQILWSVPFPYAASPAVRPFAEPKPKLSTARNATDPMKVTYVYDNFMAKKVGGVNYRNTLTTTFEFHLLNASDQPTGISGTCGPGVFDNMIVEAP